jgi:hypothetical protein
LKAPGTERLKLKYDGLFSSFAFKFNLRRYNLQSAIAASAPCAQAASAAAQAGAYTRPLFGST